MGEGKARPTALNWAVNRPHLRRKCLRRKPTPICRARNGSLARQGELVAVFGDGLRLTATVRDVGRTKSEERCLDWGERAKGPLSPCSVDWNLSPAHQSAGSFPYSGRYFFRTVGKNETRLVGTFHDEPPEADIETSSKSNISLRCRMSAWSPLYRIAVTRLTSALIDRYPHVRPALLAANPVRRPQPISPCWGQVEPAWGSSRPVPGVQCVVANTKPTPLTGVLKVSSSRSLHI